MFGNIKGKLTHDFPHRRKLRGSPLKLGIEDNTVQAILPSYILLVQLLTEVLLLPQQKFVVKAGRKKYLQHNFN